MVEEASAAAQVLSEQATSLMQLIAQFQRSEAIAPQALRRRIA
jgi:hypothetical protein